MAARLDTNAQALEFLKMNKIKDFVARTSADKDNSVIFKTNSEDTITENLENFRAIVEMTVGAYYIVESGARGAHRVEVKNERSSAPQVGNVPAQVQGIAPDEVEKRVQAAIQGLKNEMRMDELERQNKELKSEIIAINTPLNRVITKVEPYIGTLLASVVNKIIPSAPAVSLAGIERVEETDNQEGADEAEHQEEISDMPTVDQKRLMVALEKWAAADPDFLSLIEAVAEMAASGDSMYGMAKTMLKK